MKLIVICPTYNNNKYLHFMIQSFEKAVNTYYHFDDVDYRNVNNCIHEIMLVIIKNGVTTYSTSPKTKNVTELYQEKMGMYSASNLGAMDHKTDQDFLFFINDDIVFHPKTFLSIEKYLHYYGTMILPPILIAKSIQPIEAGGIHTPFKNLGQDYQNFQMDEWIQYGEELMKKDHGTAYQYPFGLYIIRGDIFDAIKYDEKYDPWNLGMADIFYRFMQYGIKDFWILNDVLVYHFISKSAQKNNNFDINPQTNYDYYVTKHGKVPSDVEKEFFDYHGGREEAIQWMKIL